MSYNLIQFMALENVPKHSKLYSLVGHLLPPCALLHIIAEKKELTASTSFPTTLFPDQALIGVN